MRDESNSFPQLRMIQTLVADPKPYVLSQAYRLRRARPDDAAAVAALLTEAFEDAWDMKKANEVLLENPEVPTTWVIEFDQTVVATASYQIQPREFPDSGWVHYVGAAAAHSGNGLGYAVVWTVIEEAKLAGKRSVRLTTDDWRLPAIRTYLRLGFEPEPWHESHPRRWAEVLKRLADPR